MSEIKEYMEKIGWCITQHEKTNHLYDDYLPYKFHLRMVAGVAEDFIHLIPNGLQLNIKVACYGHDLIEDARCSYNDCKNELGSFIAEVIYSVTNEKGRNRAERANDKYYEGILKQEGALFVKLCDRIANVQYSKLTKSRMFEMYEKENSHFERSLRWKNNALDPMFSFLSELLGTK